MRAASTISHIKRFRNFRTPASCLIVNLMIAFVIYSILRIVYFLLNMEHFAADLTGKTAWDLFIRGGLLFDCSAIAYTCSLYIVLMLLPLQWKENTRYYRVVKWTLIIPLALGILVNLADAVFYPYSLHRSTMMVFDEFKNENNLAGIGLLEAARHWYLVVLAIVLIWGSIKLYRNPVPVRPRGKRPITFYYIKGVIGFGIAIVLTICGMRGAWLWTSTRPISVNEAFRYASKPSQPALTLNTTFALLRTMGEMPAETPEYFTDPEELNRYFSPVKEPTDSMTIRNRNIVFLIIEGMSREFIGSLNPTLDNGNYNGYMPFVDSLITVSLTAERSFSNTGFSIDAMPAVLASIPRMGRPFVVSPFSVDPVNSVVTELAYRGYSSAFYHGAVRQSLGLSAFGRQAGFEKHFGREDYDMDSRFDSEKDYDGTWGIWDEEFLQYFALGISELPQPFVAGVFTLSSHHPFRVPAKYADRFPDEGALAVNKCFRYVDFALRRFFETASRQPWYDNTIFVITADHASPMKHHPEYKTTLGHFYVPVIYFDPSGQMPRGVVEGITQQTDIMPTLLGYLGFAKPYVAFGNDLLNTPAASRWAFNWDEVPQYVEGDYVMQLSPDGKTVTGLFNYIRDPLLRNDLRGKYSCENEMLKRMQAIIQSYMDRGKRRQFTIE